jgi:hypothetical protein
MRSKCSDMSLKSFAKLLTFGKGKDYFLLNKLIQSGNTKLPHTTAIFNMGPANGCPSFARGLCRAFSPDGKHICYAKKAETSRTPEVLPYRQKQARFWDKITAEEFASQFLAINSLRELPWNKLRLNESGDFYSQACVDKAEKIAMYLARGGVKVYCYTHRSDLDYSNTRHLIISGSNFQKEGISNCFMIVEDVKKDKPKGWSICPMDCKICDKCSTRGYKVVVKRH